MLSYRQPDATVLSLWNLLGILCSCFGKIHEVKSPFSRGASNPGLHVMRHRDLSRKSFYPPSDTAGFLAFDSPIIFDSPPGVLCAGGEDDDDDDDDEGVVENEDSEDLFHGQFLLGSKILTEVELESPVGEGKVLATPIRTPRSSLNRIFSPGNGDLLSDSSHSSTVDVRKSHGSSYSSLTSDFQLDFAQVCAQEPDLIHFPNENAAVTSFRNAEPSPSNPKVVLSVQKEEGHGLPNLYTGHCQSEIPCSAAQLHKSYRDRSLYVPVCKCDLDIHQSASDRGCLSHEEKRSLLIQGKQNNIEEWSMRTQQAAENFSECKMDNFLFKEETITKDRNWRDSERYKIAEKENNGVPGGSLPDCLSSDFLAARSLKKSSNRQSRARSLTDQDFSELKGCIDLGFVFRPDQVLDLCETLPALEVCYAVAHGAMSPASNTEEFLPLSPCSPPISPWRIASPGDQPQQVKARLRHWAQAVALNVWQPC